MLAVAWDSKPHEFVNIRSARKSLDSQLFFANRRNKLEWNLKALRWARVYTYATHCQTSRRGKIHRARASYAGARSAA